MSEEIFSKINEDGYGKSLIISGRSVRYYRFIRFIPILHKEIILTTLDLQRVMGLIKW